MTTTDERYNGWTNRETWALMLHINNDQGLYEDFRARVRYADEMELADARDDVEDAVSDLFSSGWWRTDADEPMPPAIIDMLREVGSLWRVNWAEVVDALRED